MSEPSCKHGNANPNHECQKCATECAISDLSTECRTLRAERDEWKASREELWSAYEARHAENEALRAERDAALAQLAEVTKERYAYRYERAMLNSDYNGIRGKLATAREALLKIAPRIRGELFESHPERIALESALAGMEAKDGSQ